MDKKRSIFDITYERKLFCSNYPRNYLRVKKSKVYFLKNNINIIANIENLNEKFKSDYYSNSCEYKTFENLFPNTVEKIEKIKRIAGKNSIYVWGAGTKGCIYLNYCKKNNILIDQIKFAIDINPNKIDKYLPGSLIKIKSKEFFAKKVKKNDVLIISNPAYKNEIIKDLKKYNSTKLKILTL